MKAIGYGVELGHVFTAGVLTLLACGLIEAPSFYEPSGELFYPAMVLGSLWVAVSLKRFVKAFRSTRLWRRSPKWSFEARDLPVEERGLALPRFISRWLVGKDPGIFIGRGFQWSPAHTQELEAFLDLGDAPLPTGADMRGGNPALHAVGIRDERPLVIPFSELVGHVLIGGTTRSGKTRLLEVIECEAIRGPGTVVILDPKGDAELLVRAAVQAHRCGRPFAFVSPAFPDQSRSFNPLGTCQTTTELAARIQALMPGGGAMAKDPFFTEYPLAIVERLGAAMEKVGDPWSIENLNAVTTLVPPLEDLIGRYLHVHVFGKGGKVPALGDKESGLIGEYNRSGIRDHLADALIDDYMKPREHFQKVTANLTPAFRGVVGGKMGQLLSKVPADLTWQRAVDENMVVYFAMSSLMFGEVANRIGRVILQDLIGFLGRRYAYDDPKKMQPITILLDEFSNIAYPGFIDALNKGGGARAHFMLAMQSLADPESAMGRDGAQRVLDNLNTRIWFRLTDDATAEVATKGLGLTNVVMPDLSESLSYGGVGGMVGGVSMRLGRTEKPLIRPEWLTAMPRGECLVRLRGENWKLRVPLLHEVSEKELVMVAEKFGLTFALAQLNDVRESAAADAAAAKAPAAAAKDRSETKAKRQPLAAPEEGVRELEAALVGAGDGGGVLYDDE